MPNRFFSLLALASLFLVQPSWGNPPRTPQYQLARVIEVAGRQGIATDGKRYFVSGSKTLHIYTKVYVFRIVGQ